MTITLETQYAREIMHTIRAKGDKLMLLNFDEFRRANSDLRDHLARVQAEAAKMLERATTDQGWVSFSLGDVPLHDPTDHAHRAAVAAARANRAAEMCYAAGKSLGYNAETVGCVLENIVALGDDFWFTCD